MSNHYHPVIATLKKKFFSLAARENGNRLCAPRLTAELDIIQEQIRALEKEAASLVPLEPQTICRLSV